MLQVLTVPYGMDAGGLLVALMRMKQCLLSGARRCDKLAAVIECGGIGNA